MGPWEAEVQPRASGRKKAAPTSKAIAFAVGETGVVIDTPQCVCEAVHADCGAADIAERGQVGRSSYLGWRWSGGAFMTGVAETVCRSFIGEYWAGTRPAPTVAARGCEHRSGSQQFQLSTTVGHAKGGVAGGIPPHKGGPKARPHRTAVVSGPRRRHLHSLRTRIGFDLVVFRGIREFTTNPDWTLTDVSACFSRRLGLCNTKFGKRESLRLSGS